MKDEEDHMKVHSAQAGDFIPAERLSIGRSKSGQIVFIMWVDGQGIACAYDFKDRQYLLDMLNFALEQGFEGLDSLAEADGVLN